MNLPRISPSSVAVVLLVFLGCHGSRSKCKSGQCHDWTCDEVPWLEASQAELERYRYSPDDIHAAVNGTWVAEYPGGRLVGVADIRVSVQSDPSRLPRVGIPSPLRDGYQVNEDDWAECLQMVIAAEVKIESSSSPALCRELKYLQVNGPSLLDDPDLSDSTLVPPSGPRGVPYAQNGHSAVVAVALGLDGSLWLSYEQDGFDFKECGRR